MPDEQKSSGGGMFYDGLKILEIRMDGTPRTIFIFIESAKAAELKAELENDISFKKKRIKIAIIEQQKFPIDIVIRRFMTLEFKGSKYTIFVKAGMIRKKGSPDHLN